MTVGRSCPEVENGSGDVYRRTMERVKFSETGHVRWDLYPDLFRGFSCRSQGDKFIKVKDGFPL